LIFFISFSEERVVKHVANASRSCFRVVGLANVVFMNNFYSTVHSHSNLRLAISILDCWVSRKLRGLLSTDRNQSSFFFYFYASFDRFWYHFQFTVLLFIFFQCLLNKVIIYLSVNWAYSHQLPLVFISFTLLSSWEVSSRVVYWNRSLLWVFKFWVWGFMRIFLIFIRLIFFYPS
jgi:hypothetical protein